MSATHAKTLQDRSATPGNKQFEQIKYAIEERLAELLPKNDDSDDLLTEAMRNAVLRPGKRVRPMLLMSIVRDLDHHSSASLDIACSIEMVHAASLVLDDLPCMDDAKLRRGHPAIHIEFGENVAVLAAVALLSCAFSIVACMEDVSPTARTRLTAVLAQAVGAQGLAKGQFQDLHGTHKKPASEIAITNALKTGALLGVAIEMAAIIAQTSAEVTQCLRYFASAAGQAFQIRDDLLDAGVGPALAAGEVIGKDTGQDAGKATLPNTLGAEGAQLRMASELRQAKQHLQQALGPHNETYWLVEGLFPQCGLP
jgi:geranylgeranyl diphosphate synthase type II